MEFVSVALPEMAPAAVRLTFPAMVLLLMVTVPPEFAIVAASFTLPVMVLLITVRRPEFAIGKRKL
jgi:hypothetical protein